MKELGELEHKIMHVVWREPGVSVREVCDLLQDDKQRAYTTVMTTLDRLHRKGHVSREKDGLAWRYRGTRTGEEFRQALADHLAARIVLAHTAVRVVGGDIVAIGQSAGNPQCAVAALPDEEGNRPADRTIGHHLDQPRAGALADEGGAVREPLT